MRLFPNASNISPKQLAPPHFAVFQQNADGTQVRIGVAFLTTELEPLERGYDGPIKILVGMDVTGTLVGVDIVEHREPYGYFSVETAEFKAQFVGKSIRDPFKVGGDIDAISRASISMESASRAIRNASRRVAGMVLTPPAR